MLGPSTQNAVYWSTLFLSKCSTHFCYLYDNYFFEVYSYFTTQILLSYNAHCHSFKAQAFPQKCYCWVGKNRIQQPHWLYKSSILGRRIKKKQQTKTSIVWHMDNYKIKFSEGFTIGENLKFIASSTEPLSYWLADFTVVNCMLMSERAGRDIHLLDRKHRG